MTWTPPRPWNAGDVVGASDLSAYLNGNLMALWNRPRARFSGAVGVSTTSTSWVSVSNVSLDVYTNDNVDVLCHGFAWLTWTNGAAFSDRVFMRPTFDGGVFWEYIGQRLTWYGNNANYFVYPIMATANMSAGMHTIGLQWYVAGTAGIGVTLASVMLLVQEIGAGV